MSDLLIASAQAAALAVLVLAIELLARSTTQAGLPAVIRYALWWIVVLRLALPAPVPDPLGWERPTWWSGDFACLAVPAAPGGEAAASVGEPRAVRLDWGLGARAARDESTDDAGGTPVAGGAPEIEPAVDRPVVARRATPTPRAVAPPAVGDPPTRDARGAALLPTLGWGLGCAVCLLRALLAELVFRRRVLRTARPAGARATAAFDGAMRALGVRGPVQLLETAAIDAPAAHGVLRRRVLLPAGMADRTDDVALAFALRHELAHLRARDPFVNVCLAVVEAVHWFNPLAWLAASRLREEREPLRDASALRAAPALDPDRSARSLLDAARARLPSSHPTLATLAPARRSALRKRLEMILSLHRSRRTPVLAGALCCAGLGWAGLSAARPVERAPAGAAAATALVTVHAGDPIRVVRRDPEPTWEAGVRAKLATPLRWGAGITLESWPELVRRETGLVVHLAPELAEEHDLTGELAPLAVTLPLHDALDHLCWAWGDDIAWRPVEGGVCLEPSHLGRGLELRFYDVRALSSGADAEVRLMDLVYHMAPNGWDQYDAQMEFWQRRLLIRQTPRQHEELKRLLDRVAGAIPPSEDGVPADLARRLAQPCNLQLQGSRPEVLNQLAAAAGIALFQPRWFVDEAELVSVSGAGRPLSAVLAEAAGEHHVTVAGGAVLIGDRLPLAVRIYDVSDLIAVTDQEVRDWFDEEPSHQESDVREAARASIRDEKQERLMELLRYHVSPAVWDELEGANMMVWDDSLVIAQTEPMHAEVASFLDAARRALRD
ncbi:MAG: M56 family metallopeptidase [Planctomycetes bacterium]|nr:M56 family metallopeptidase [Planctomycetota bacterium]